MSFPWKPFIITRMIAGIARVATSETFLLSGQVVYQTDATLFLASKAQQLALHQCCHLMFEPPHTLQEIRLESLGARSPRIHSGQPRWHSTTTQCRCPLQQPRHQALCTLDVSHPVHLWLEKFCSVHVGHESNLRIGRSAK